MFSPDVERDAKQLLAFERFNDIRDIYAELKDEVSQRDFLEKPFKEIKDQANNFINSFAIKYGMNTHTVRPYAWSFVIGDDQLFEDGIIELFFDNNKNAFFSYVDVSRSKITEAS